MISIFGFSWDMESSVASVLDTLTNAFNAYVNALSMGIGEAPLWSLLVTFILVIELYKLPRNVRRAAREIRSLWNSVVLNVKPLLPDFQKLNVFTSSQPKKDK
jgi:hypothetical protein